MATVNVLVRRPPEQVWDVLADGSCYADWVVGTKEIRAVDDGWPAVGTSIHYTVGVGPLELRGRTTVRVAEEHRRLGLEADAGLIGTARIVIDLVPWGDETVVELDESPLRGPAYQLHTMVSDALLLVRGRPMVANLARLVEARHPD
jgi:carbon monoxide dehydrogenase subunit G